MGDIITKDDALIISTINSFDRMTTGIESLMENYKPPFNGERFLTDKELSEKIKISRRTLQEWRNEGKIEYIQLEGKILYTESAVQRVLEKHYVKAWE